MKKQGRKNNQLNMSFALKPLVKHVSIALTFGAGTLLASNLVYAEAIEQTNTQQEATVSKKIKETSDNDGSRLGSVTVTAQKREETVQEVATAISTLDGKALIDEGIGRSASEVLNYVPNASAGTQQHGRPRWWIRGVGAGQQQFDLANPVGFYNDEVYISNATATGFPLFDLDRVEVLRGPQGTLWGKNTTGGAISVVSKKPSFNESKNDNYVKLDYGSYNDRVVQGGVGAVLIDERLAGRISFYNEDTDGRLNNLFTGGKDGGLADSAIRGQLLAELTPNLEALLNFHYRKYEADGAITTAYSYASNGVFRNGYKPSTNIRDVSANAPTSDDTTQNGASLNLKWQLGKFALTSISAYEDLDRETFLDGDYTPLEISRGRTKGKSKQYSQEFRLASPKEDRWNWLAGVHLFKEDVNFDAQNAQLNPATVAGLAGAVASATAGAAYNASTLTHVDKSFAIFGSNTYNLTDQLEATLGLRWTTENKKYNLNRIGSAAVSSVGNFSNLGQWWNSYTGALAVAGLPQSGTFSSSESKTWNNFTYDFTPEYKITPHDRVYFKYAHGVKSGGFNTAATNLASANSVQPEQLDAYEVGYKSEWLDGRLNFNTSIFHYNYQDVQVNVVGTVPNTSIPVSYLQNASKATINGAEFEIEALPTDRLHIKSSLGLLDTKYDDLIVLGSGTSLAGNELVRSPHLTAQVIADYRIPLANGGKLVAGGDIRFTSKQFYFVTPQSDARNALNQGAYSLTNARLSYLTANDKYTWTAYVNNVFDKEYKNHSLPANNPTAGINGDSIYWAAPRTAGVSFTARF